jgi:hypothetical protein
MKRDRIIQFFLTLLAVATLWSCKKALDEKNPSGLTAETTYTTAAGFESLVNAAYGFNRFWYGKEEGYSVTEMGTDIWTSGTADVYPQLTQYNNLQGANTAALTLLWNNTYAALNLCNQGITDISSVSDMTSSQKTLREAELRFLRAHNLWLIAETWGDVHFTTEPTKGVVTEANRTSVDTFYAQIFRDLDFAVANLPVAQSQWGRVTKGAARAFQARMFLTRGRNAEAAAAAGDVIRFFGYSLQPRYIDIWNMANLKGREIIWSVDYSATLTYNDLTSTTYPYGHSRGSNNGHLMFLMVYDQVNTAILIRDLNNGRPFNRYMPTKKFLDLFDDTMDSRYQGSFQTVWYANKAALGFAVGDTAAFATKNTLTPADIASRKYTTYDASKVYGADGIPTQRRFYVSLKKFKDSTRPNLAEAQSARDAFVIRLGEVYLIAAEAHFKAGQADSAAAYLNVIRRRAAIPGKEAAMEVLPADITLDFILDERARELGGEQLRWFDLKRSGKLQDRIMTMNPDAAKYYKSYHSLRPIPQTQLDAVSNKSEFTQNPGYQ